MSPPPEPPELASPRPQRTRSRSQLLHLPPRDVSPARKARAPDPLDFLAYGAINQRGHSQHRHYLEQGGAGFVLGDGKLNYALEQILEVYYRVQLLRFVQTSLDYQFIQNPGYNRDRGPAHVIGGRLRVSF